ncbi:2Fe-2S iron-sulfur cluster-binding protein [Streptomyces sp. NPDC050704]|uniref:2Fe-2S iron-sulfur cluster-binding protein n=1 Tax=Streptomyces sp. NPDC050704 TaxID=3157219 RepID=UPI00343C10BD
MTDDQHGEGAPRAGSRWDPLPQGDYDDGATAFVKLPEGGIDALLADSPLAAPGHGYVPPSIAVTPATDPGTDPATGSWTVPPGIADGGPPQAVQWPDPNSLPEEHRQPAQDAFGYNPGATGQWTFEEPSRGGQGAPGHDATGHDVTGQWSIPVADGELPDESGEFTTSALVEQWGGGTPPATLPGGAAAPWASEPWAHEQAADQPSPADEAASHAEQAAEIIDVSGEHADEIAVSVERESVEREEPRDERGERVGAPAGHGGPEHGYEPEPADGPGGGPEAASPEEPAEAHDDMAEEPAPDDSPATPPHNDHPLASYVLRVNGADRPVTDAWIGESLLYVLRERLGLAGAKDGCSQGECGACNVQVDGRLVASCLVPAVTAAGSEVRTVEGLATDGQPSDVQRAFAKCGAVQCGFCVPGMAMTVHDLLEGNPAPTELETRQALCGNLCRCSGYRGVLDAVREVVSEREAHAAAESATDAEEPRIPHQAGPGAGGVNPSAFEPAQPHEQPYGQDGGQA